MYGYDVVDGSIYPVAKLVALIEGDPFQGYKRDTRTPVSPVKYSSREHSDYRTGLKVAFRVLKLSNILHCLRASSS